MNDLQIVVDLKPGMISTNFIDIKKSLSTQMQVYKELEVTEENKPERKKDVATLRKMQKSITEKKSEVRNKCLEPYEEFNKLANELAEIINEPIQIIDNQVKEFEDKQRLAKIAEIMKIYSELIGDLADNLPIDKIYDSKWENTATSKKSIREDLTSRIEKVRQEVNVINSMVSDKTPEALEYYWIDLNLARAVDVINSYEEYKKKILAQQEEKQRKDKEAELEKERVRIREEERKRIQEEERIREDERQKAIEDEARIRAEESLATEKKLMGIKVPVVSSTVEMDLEAPFTAEDELPFVTVGEIRSVFTVIGTADELRQVEMYLNSIGLFFERKDV